MKVSLAVQLLSQSVASSMEYLMNCGHTGFENCEDTIEFTQRLNNLFDILSSRNDADGEFKLSLCPANKDKIFAYLNECREYLEKLTISSGLLIDSTKKTGAKGLIIDITSLMMFYEEYVDNQLLSKVPVYLFNQDPLESFFGRIRSFPGLGHNDNPIVVQFNAAYRKNVVKTEITSSAFANCLDKLDILYSPSTDHDKKKERGVMSQSNDNQVADEATGCNEPQMLPDANLCEYDCSIEHDFSDKFDETITIAYIAVSIEDRITNMVTDCDEYRSIFEENDKIEATVIPNRSKLPCKDTYHLCRVAYKQLEIDSNKTDFDYLQLLSSIYCENDFRSIFTNLITSINENFAK